MPLQNRVTPAGEIIATSARGTFLGNRGILHDENKRIVRGPKTRMWLICQLEFNGRKQELMRPNRYTQLFFLDEAVALAAGHRPCGECRRTSYRGYIDAANIENETPIGGAGDLDRQLNESRKAPRNTVAISTLPDGVFITLGENDFRLIWAGALHRWSPDGYIDPMPIADSDVLAAPVLTPALSVAALRHGYPVAVHSSAGGNAAPPRRHGAPAAVIQKPARVMPESKAGAAGTWTSSLTPGLRAEIEQILRTSSPGLTHGEMFRYLERGLDEQQMASEHGTRVSNVRNFLTSVKHLLGGTMPTTKSAARTNSMVYKELLNHVRSDALDAYAHKSLHHLMDINPEINMKPLQTRSHQYATNGTRRGTQQAVCPACHQAHAGECY